jgi:hypothetical protein
MGWQEDNSAPTGIRELWLRCTYRGPSAWLVRLNLVIALFAFSPLMLLGVVASGISLHMANNAFFMFIYLLSFVLAEFSYVFLIPTLAAGIVMCASPSIPLGIKAKVGIVELAACAQLLWFLRAARVAGRCGLLGCP